MGDESTNRHAHRGLGSLWGIVAAWALVLAACSASQAAPGASPGPAPSTAPETVTTSPPLPPATHLPSSTTEPGPPATSPPEPATTTTSVPPTGAGCEREQPTPAGGVAAAAIELQEGGGGLPHVEAVVYPHADYEGRPWSQWGEGHVLGDGRFVSAIGDHRGKDGNSYLYSFDPTTGTLSLQGDVLSLVDHTEGEWGFGKVHARIVGGECSHVYLATYWGTRRGLEYSGGYSGDLLLRWDTITNRIETLGVPVPEHGIPSLAAPPGASLIYGEAVDPFSQPDAGAFFVWDPAGGDTILVAEGNHVGFRNILVDGAGRAYFSAGDGMLDVYDPATGELTKFPARLPGAWLRASTGADAAGIVYGVTRNPDVLFALDPSGAVRTVAPVSDYVASLAFDPSRHRLYYVPGAHGTAWRQGTPLVSVDPDTGESTVIVRLNDLAEERLGLRLGGTYDVVADPQRGRIFIGFNAGPAGADSFGEVVLVVVELR